MGCLLVAFRSLHGARVTAQRAVDPRRSLGGAPLSGGIPHQRSFNLDDRFATHTFAAAKSTSRTSRPATSDRLQHRRVHEPVEEGSDHQPVRADRVRGPPGRLGGRKHSRYVVLDQSVGQPWSPGPAPTTVSTEPGPEPQSTGRLLSRYRGAPWSAAPPWPSASARTTRRNAHRPQRRSGGPARPDQDRRQGEDGSASSAPVHATPPPRSRTGRRWPGGLRGGLAAATDPSDAGRCSLRRSAPGRRLRFAM